MDSLKLKVTTSAGRISKFISNAKRTGKENRTEQFLTARIQLLENYWENYQKLHEELVERSTAEEIKKDPYFSEDVFSDIECAYIEVSCWLNEELEVLRPNVSSQNISGLNSSTRSSVDVQMCQQVKLPKVNLPTFTGSYLNWQTFNDTYTSLIHTNTSLSDIQKMHYLKSSLSGDAAKLLNHLAVTSANYPTAWNILINRYQNTRLLVNSNLNALMTIPAMSAESSNELRRVLDLFIQAVRSLENLKRPVTQWNDWLVYILANKLDQSTRKDWETTISSSVDIPSFEELKTFLEGRLHTLDAIPQVSIPDRKSSQYNRFIKPAKSSHHIASSTRSCINCRNNHLLMFCPNFRALSISERNVFVQRNKLCLNCLRSDHSVNTCSSQNRCKHCSGKHHTMLHREQNTRLSVQPREQAEASSSNGGTAHSNSPSYSLNESVTQDRSRTSNHEVTNAHLSNNGPWSNFVLLTTAIIVVQSPNGRTVRARALLDQGSESSFITASLANLLRLPKRKVRISILGIGGSEAKVAESYVKHNIISLIEPEKIFEVQSLVLPTLTHLIPSQPIHRENWPHLKGLQLADPDFDVPARVDVILGADVYSRILLNDIRQGPIGTPLAQRTALGWILSGGVVKTQKSHISTANFHCSVDNDLHILMQKFWEVDRIPDTTHITPEEESCEKFFHETHRRDESGRYIVRLPMKSCASTLGESRSAALSTFTKLERRFAQNADLRTMYTAFMEEYLRLHHMELVPNETNAASTNTYYLPHHAVLKPTSTTTKLRVVFNASQNTNTGVALNDLLHIGPKLQKNVYEILMKWRIYPIVFSADIEKMYRQVLVESQDTDLQRILWRRNTSEPLECYRLLTVTYGTACAPYLACKVLQQLADDYDSEFPTAATILREHFYVDDALFGAFNQDLALQARDELRTLLSRGGFNLRKWQSNCTEMLVGIPNEDREIPSTLRAMTDEEFKALGILWSPQHDHFTFQFHMADTPSTTKRQVLADISRLYDPLGWLSPTTIRAKIFMQKIWLSGCNWDDELQPDMLTEWLNYRRDLDGLSIISVDRWIGVTSTDVAIELHGFSDASNAAYGAVVYLRILHDITNVQVSLLAAKTRVSPLKTISLPRLELCGAALLAELMSSVRKTLNLGTVSMHAWTDSTIVLAWLKDHPSKWKTFVANRVSNIQQNLSSATWRHVSSEENPADCITRGISPNDLKTFKLWWFGPIWLSQHSTCWPNKLPQCKSIPMIEERQQAITHVSRNQPNTLENDLLHRYSNLNKLLRITTYCRRFATNSGKGNTQRVVGPLKRAEIATSLITLIRSVQQTFFGADMKTLSSNTSLSGHSQLRKLNPFIDDQNILRVGGRLKHSLLSFEENHPIILPKTSHLTHLLIDYAHTATLHGGIQITLHYLRNKYWILHARSKVRQFIRQCVVCYRYQANAKSQIMSDLPADRIRPSKPFVNSGVDFAGPLVVKPIKGRGKTAVKVYVAVFICLSTRAIHLELVMDLSSDAFQAAFKRFVSRRGRCSKLYSDNATNFVAADKELTHHLRQLCKEGTTSIQQELVNDGTEWHFIPPSSPHFGGLWEAGVKSLKHHLRRIVGNHVLSIEEMLTLLSQVEACLNSRPLHAINDDPDEFSALTPGHFLVGESLISVPDPSLTDVPINRLNRWQLVQQMKENIWIRWQREYLHHLQLRNKWCRPEDSIKINDLVLIREDNLPPTKWLLGRVVAVHPGTDGHIRVATIKHKNGSFLRPITKLCVLPLNNPN